MKPELEKLLAYQKLDIKLKKLDDEIKQSDEFKSMRVNKSRYAESKAVSEDSEVMAERVVKEFSDVTDILEKTAKQMQALVEALESGDLDEQRENETALQLKNMLNNYDELAKRAEALKVSAEKAVDKYKKAAATAKTAKEQYASAKAKVEEKKRAKKAEIDALEAEKAAARSAVDPEVLKRYESVTAEGKYPALVPLMNESCGGCGMMMSQSTKTDLDKNDYCICESCHRMIYRP